jgi:acetyl-CoA carboxylase biotin carboxyl carrier protein
MSVNQISHFPFDLPGKTDLPKRPAPQLTTAVDLKDIKAIIDLMKENDLSVFEMEKDGLKIKLQKEIAPSAAPAPAASVPHSAPAPPQSAAAAEATQLKEIVSPMVGTFYSSPAPDAAPFVDVGAQVNEDTVVGIIEAMKVMNEIKAETSGVIADVAAENGKPVQFGQVLFRVR